MGKKKHQTAYDKLSDEEKTLVDWFAKTLKNKWVNDAEEATKSLTWPLVERMLDWELEEQIWYNYYQHWDKNIDNRNYRNGKTKKQVRSSSWDMEIYVPRDRNWQFEPIVLPKHSKDISSFEEKIIWMYARWMSTYDIQDMLYDIYGSSIDSTTISRIVSKVEPQIRERQERKLERCYPIVYFDAVHFKTHVDGVIKSIAIYIAMWYDINGYKDILGIYTMWDSESAKDWLKVFNDLKNRWVEKICIVSVDNLNWISEAIKSVFEDVEIQKCIVHQVRNSLRRVSAKDKKEITKDMKLIYEASSEETGEQELDKFASKWENKYPLVVKSWINNWEELRTLFKYSKEIRRIIYTTNPIESVNRNIRKYTKIKSVYPNEEAVIRWVYLALEITMKKWTKKASNWDSILNQLNIYFNWELEKYISI